MRTALAFPDPDRNRPFTVMPFNSAFTTSRTVDFLNQTTTASIWNTTVPALLADGWSNVCWPCSQHLHGNCRGHCDCHDSGHTLAGVN